jgi:predicted small metal-binding protein
MKTFACKDVHSDCAWSAAERTSDLLTERIALHLRETHGKQALTLEEVGWIRNRFQAPGLDDAADAVDTIMHEYNCSRDPRCTWEFIAQAEAILTGNPNPHSRELVGR